MLTVLHLSRYISLHLVLSFSTDIEVTSLQEASLSRLPSALPGMSSCLLDCLDVLYYFLNMSFCRVVFNVLHCFLNMPFCERLLVHV